MGTRQGLEQVGFATFRDAAVKKLLLGLGKEEAFGERLKNSA